MGTSISQRSPHRSQDAGEKWADVCSEVSIGIKPNLILPKIIDAYREQFNDGAKDLIVDSGVRKVESMLQQLKIDPNKVPLACTDFMFKVKMELSKNKENSFFAELAIKAASAAILSTPENVISQFKKNFLVNLADYILSRDQVTFIGTKGVPNIYSKLNLVQEIQKEVEKLKKVDEPLVDLISKLKDG